MTMILTAEEYLNIFNYRTHFHLTQSAISLLASIDLSDDQKTEAYRHFQEINSPSSSSTSSIPKPPPALNENYILLAEYEYRIYLFSLEKFSNKLPQLFLDHCPHLETYTFTRILTKNYFLARELYSQITSDNITPEILAIQYSLGSEAMLAGHLGPLKRSALSSDIVEKLRGHTTGFTTDPFSFNKQWCILTIKSHTKPKLDLQTKHLLLKDAFFKYVKDHSNRS